jgi:hypothetical protein
MCDSTGLCVVPSCPINPPTLVSEGGDMHERAARPAAVQHPRASKVFGRASYMTIHKGGDQGGRGRKGGCVVDPLWHVDC